MNKGICPFCDFVIHDVDAKQEEYSKTYGSSNLKNGEVEIIDRIKSDLKEKEKNTEF